MSSWAVPGAKCVCVYDAWKHGGGPEYLGPRPVRGKTYLIEAVEVDDDSRVFLFLKEFPWAVRFWAERFRPLTKSTKTQEEDIAMFWDILAEEGERV